MKPIIVFGKRGQVPEDIDPRLATWSPKPDFFYQDMPDYVLDVPAIHDLESKATHCGQDAVKKYIDQHVPRLKTRERLQTVKATKPEVEVTEKVEKVKKVEKIEKVEEPPKTEKAKPKRAPKKKVSTETAVAPKEVPVKEPVEAPKTDDPVDLPAEEPPKPHEPAKLEKKRGRPATKKSV